MSLSADDPEISAAIRAEADRQRHTLNMIPSENIVSDDVREASSSVLMHKYSEGYPGKRYYQGNAHIDVVERIAIERAKALFGADHANVQPLSGSPANFSVYLALLEPGDVILGMDLASGGHLTHGSTVNFSGKIYKAVGYGVDEKTKWIDMEAVRRLARKHKPRIIVSGHSAYPRAIDFAAFGRIAKEVGAYHLADMSHIAGLVATGKHENPVPHADVVTSTTHKTLRGPRGAIILCREEHAKAIDKAVFPGSQGGPHNHMIAAKAVAFREASSPRFADYIDIVVKSASRLAELLSAHGLSLVTGGTDNHLLLIDLTPTHGAGNGRKIAQALERAGVIANANGVPFDSAPPYRPSGLRLGTPMLVSQGFGVEDMDWVASCITRTLDHPEDEGLLDAIAAEVRKRCDS